MSEIGGIGKDLLDCCTRPKMMGFSRVGNPEFFFLVIGRRFDTFFVQGIRDLVGADTLSSHFKHPKHIACRRLVTNGKPVFIIPFNVAIRRGICPILSRFGVGFDDGADLLTGACRVPFIKHVHNRHHIHTGIFGICRIHVITESDKTDVVHGENIIGVLSHLNIVSSKAAEILDDNDVDPAGLGILQKPFYLRSVEAGAAPSVVDILVDHGKALFGSKLAKH